MRYLFLFMLLLAIPFASAAEYWTLAPDEGGAANVVNAANFAASMKASAGVTFTGKTVSQAREALVTQDIAEVLIVIFDGADVRVMRSRLIDDTVVENVRVYLEEQGFDVRVTEPDMRFFFSERASGDDEEAEQAPGDAPEQDFDLPEEGPDEVQDLPERSPAAPEKPSTPPPPAAPEEDDEQGFFARVWRWFAGLF